MFRPIVHNVVRLGRCLLQPKLRRVEAPPAGHCQAVEILKEADRVVLPNPLEVDFGLKSAADVVLEIPAVERYHLRDVYCAGNQGMIFFRDGGAFTTCRSTHRLPDRKFRRPVPWLARRIKEPVFHLTGFSHDNHGHFMLHHLPRLAASMDLLERHPDLRILCAEGHQKWQARYLRAFGIGPERLIGADEETLLLDSLHYVPIRDGTDRLCHPQWYRDIQRRLKSQVTDRDRRQAAAKSKGARHIWLHRFNAPDKRLTNERELVDITREHWPDLEVIELADFQLLEQVALLEQVEVVFGPIGQALTVVLFGTGTRLVILSPWEEGQKPVGAEYMFRSLALLSGNEGLRLYSGSQFDFARQRCWSYPPDRYRQNLRRLQAVGF